MQGIIYISMKITELPLHLDSHQHHHLLHRIDTLMLQLHYQAINNLPIFNSANAELHLRAFSLKKKTKLMPQIRTLAITAFPWMFTGNPLERMKNSFCSTHVLWSINFQVDKWSLCNSSGIRSSLVILVIARMGVYMWMKLAIEEVRNW